jgi:hypothetical protein
VYIQTRVLLEKWKVADPKWVFPESVLKRILAALSKTLPEMVLAWPLDQTPVSNLHRPGRD